MFKYLDGSSLLIISFIQKNLFFGLDDKKEIDEFIIGGYILIPLMFL